MIDLKILRQQVELGASPGRIVDMVEQMITDEAADRIVAAVDQMRADDARRTRKGGSHD